ncbi:MAG: SDR family oxidoreductase, partial [Planctomycetota bacterium]
IELSRAFGRRFQEQGRGTILNIGWDQSDRGMEGDSGELFATAKNAVMGFSRSLAVSLAPHVRVNCIAPGWIRTAWGENASDYWQQRVMTETPLKRWGEPQDIANMARFLLSDDASYITGQVIYVNGGAVR